MVTQHQFFLHFSTNPLIHYKKIFYILILCYMPFSLTKASSLVLPTILSTMNVSVSKPQGFGSLYVSDNTDFPYSFYASADWSPAGQKVVSGDIYFGILSPDRQQVWTFAPDENGIGIHLGYMPYEADSLNESFISEGISYTFTGNEPRGMYLMFLIKVNTGLDPSNPKNWRNVRTHPFFHE